MNVIKNNKTKASICFASIWKVDEKQSIFYLGDKFCVSHYDLFCNLKTS